MTRLPTRGSGVFWILAEFLMVSLTVSSGQNARHTARAGHRATGKHRAEGSGSTGHSKWGNTWLVASNCRPGLGTVLSSVSISDAEREMSTHHLCLPVTPN